MSGNNDCLATENHHYVSAKNTQLWWVDDGSYHPQLHPLQNTQTQWDILVRITPIKFQNIKGKENKISFTRQGHGC